MREDRKIKLASFLVAELAQEFHEHGISVPPIAEVMVGAAGAGASGVGAGADAVGAGVSGAGAADADAAGAGVSDGTGVGANSANDPGASDTPTQPFDELWLAFRAMVNVRPPWPASRDFLIAQDELLSGLIEEAGIHTVADARVSDRAGLGSAEYDARDSAQLTADRRSDNSTHDPSSPTSNTFPTPDRRMRLWHGDITTIATDAIVNAANAGMTGCWQPLHYCIDNAIHTFAGIQLRAECAALMAKQGHEEPTAHARVTSAYNLPSKHVIHTVGPIAAGHPTDEDRTQLAQCYRACLDTAMAHGCLSIAFCCISTGVFGFPQEEAAEIAVRTVRAWLETHESSPMIVVFNVFGDADEAIYERLLGC